MSIPVRRFLGMVLGILALLGPLSASGQAQLRAPVAPAVNPGLFNPYVNPFMAGALVGPQNVLAAAGMTHPLAALAGAGWGWNSALPFGANAGALAAANQLGYGNLWNGGGGGFGMAGTLLNSAAAGAGYAYGYGWAGTQWMQNPYEGYLQGAADITRANAQYYLTIQQAKLTRQEAIRSSLETRRAMIEEADWERAHMPDPEKIRQRALETELNRARVSPPLTDIWTARALNSLLRHLVAQQGEGVRGPKVPLNEDIINHINVTAGDTRGNVALLRDNGNLEWPESLQRDIFKEDRDRMNELMKDAYKSVASGNNPRDATLNDLQATFRKLRNTLNSNIDRFKPDEYFEARRYLDELNSTLTALKDPNVGKQFNSDWKPTAKDVAQLVRFMREKGLRFAPASAKDEAAYVALYHALAAFDAGLPRIASSSRGNPDNADNK